MFPVCFVIHIPGRTLELDGGLIQLILVYGDDAGPSPKEYGLDVNPEPITDRTGKRMASLLARIKECHR
jgi:hypothetical protein